MSARELLGDSGPLSRHLPGYEVRAGQLEMADAVERALAEDRILLCEAGTGTGKTLAYLVPAILSGRKVVVSTATRALQEQIAERDLPLIERALGIDPRAQVMKGLSNYLCLRRFEEARRRSLGSAIGTVETWRRETESGDIAELDALAEDAAIWREVTSSSDTRVGSACEHYEECFVTRMKRRAERARLLIVNHHLFFADLALRGPHPGRVIPDYDAVIFDEAHQLEDVATDFFGIRVSSARIDAFLRDAERAFLFADSLKLGSSGRWESVVNAVRTAAERFWRQLSGDAGAARESRVPVERDLWVGELAAAWHELDARLEDVANVAASIRGALSGPRQKLHGAVGLSEALEVVERRAGEARDNLAVIAEGAPGRVTWLETTARKRVLSSSPVDLSATFRDKIFESVPAVVLTSATLATGTESESPFRYLRSRVGLGGEDLDVTELLVPSPFDFEGHALLYTPKDLPSPRSPEFEARASERIAKLVELTDGGAFVLTTSLRSMRGLARSLREALPDREILLQGDAPKTRLLESFRQSGSAVLVATMGFWEGVDVPGSALRLVVLEKVPFSVPTDPIAVARANAIEAEGGNPFMELSVPSAAILLKQGFGRLIRTVTDHGIVALLDERVHRRGYGKRLLATLPPARRSDDLAEVEQAWRAMSQVSVSCATAAGPSR